MRRLALAMTAASLCASTAAALARPQVEPLVLAVTETETARPDANIDPPAEVGAPAAERAPPANPLWAIPISKLAATRDRPLFSVSRRPLAPAVAAAPAPPPPVAVSPEGPAAPPFSLIGTIIGEKDKIAIFFDEASKNSTGVREGESDSGWTLRSVNARSAVVEGSGRTVTLDLPEPEAQDSAPPAAPPAAPPTPAARARQTVRGKANGL